MKSFINIITKEVIGLESIRLYEVLKREQLDYKMSYRYILKFQLAELCVSEHITFIGPAIDNMAAFSLKHHARDIAIQAGVPVLTVRLRPPGRSR